ncbi:hypothetical protein KR093_005626, partial [Drosophila rubida]
ESLLSGIERFYDDENAPRASLEQMQRRSSIVYENAQLKASALQKLLKNMDDSWLKQPQPPKPVAVTQQPTAPQAYGFKDIYNRKKQQLLLESLQQERTQRQFHSRPMPNFRQVHEQQANKQVVHRITRPVTPNVLRKSQQMLLKRSQKVEQIIQQREIEEKLELQLRPKAKPVPKPKRAPLKPQNSQSSAQWQSIVKPFQLCTELRAEQRKLFNAQSQLAQENRRRELETQRKRVEQEEYLKQRQLATFRARPNPFRAH